MVLDTAFYHTFSYPLRFRCLYLTLLYHFMLDTQIFSSGINIYSINVGNSIEYAIGDKY